MRAAKLVVQPHKPHPALFEILLAQAEGETALAFVVDPHAASQLAQFLDEAGPEVGAFPRELLVGRHVQAFALYPDKAEIRPGRAEIRVAAV